MKILELSTEQRELLPVIRDKWIKIGLSTEPADRVRAEAALVWMYKQANLDPPKIIWCESPMAMVLALMVLRSGGTLEGQVTLKSMQRKIKDMNGKIEKPNHDLMSMIIYGQHDAYWLGFYDVFREFGLVEQTQMLHGLWELCKSAGWAIPCEGVCLVSERHTTLNRDPEKRLHSADDYAVCYPDGWGLCVWHGTVVPSSWILDKENLDPKTALVHENVEQRRAAAEIIGWDRILSSLKTRVIHVDPDPQIGTLLEVDLPDAPNSRFVRVLCGTGREFTIPVPDSVATAREAVAWTYGLTVDEYQPEYRA